MVRPNLHDPGAALGTIKAKLCERPWRPALTVPARVAYRESGRDEGTVVSTNQGTDEMMSRR
jgi:hypothetical protein